MLYFGVQILSFVYSAILITCTQIRGSYRVLYNQLTPLGTMHGAGIHLWDLPISAIPLFSYVSYAFSLSRALTKSSSNGALKQLDITETALYGATVFCIKLSILLFFLNLSVSRNFHFFIYGTIAFVTMYCLICVLQFTFTKTFMPVKWELFISSGPCSGPPAVCITIAGLNVFTDSLIFLIPLTVLWNLRMTRREKGSLILIFTLGSSYVHLSL